MTRGLKAALAIALSFAIRCTPAQTAQPHASHVPFAGCKSDGQVGPQEAPSGHSKAVSIPTEAAEKLAYYRANEGVGVLAPRGWYCFGTYGSNGSTLYVSPTPIRNNDLFFATKGFTGPVIQLSSISGDTSGRFTVARSIARVFPGHQEFVKNVIAEGIESSDAFPSGPYPADKLTYKSKELVEYETPAQSEGLGTASRLLKNASPIRGAAILVGDTPDLVFLAVRLSPDFEKLTSAIIEQTESDAADQDDH
ncbi:MAG TPA: hypothetical protein VKZ53_18140 [Candidatus Angelobacter sp.]|nr:hypothetical protein [Candidatus Angelobacter sp.]